MTLIFSSLNVGLHRSQACGKNSERKFRAIARGVRQAFEDVKVDAMGLVEVGDTEEGLPVNQAARLLEIIQDGMPNTHLHVHASPLDSPYMLLSKEGSKANIKDVRVVKDFVAQSWRKALRATFVEANGEVD